MIRRDRIARVQERLRAAGLHAYLVLTHDDYTWLLGEDRYQPRAIVPAQGPPVVLCFRGEADEVRASLGVEDVRVFETVGQPIADVLSVMRTLAGGAPGGKSKVAVQLGFETPAFLLPFFQQVNPDVAVVDVAPVMNELRAVKDPDELALMEHVAAIADEGMTAAARALTAGVRENDVAAEAEYAMRRAGGHGTATPIFVSSGPRSCRLHGTATDRRLRAGELVVVDLVPRRLGYCANLCRTFVVDAAPSPEQKALLDDYEAALRAAIARLTPGTIVREIDEAARAALPRELAELYVPGISHGIGLAFEEWPMPTLHPAHSRATLREGMVVTAGHSILARPGVGGARFGDTFVVTPGAPRPLTRFPLRAGG